jgi:hypothetical protein
VLRSETGRAIPEVFLQGIKQAGIEPLIQFQFSLEHLPAIEEVRTLFEVYARWGARYLLFFDRPNARSAWPSSGWVQQDLVERFLDRYIPAASLAVKMGLIPVFPPLEPGGSYWDTAFLRSALQSLQRRKQDQILENLVLSAYGWTGGHPLNWGRGGPERWPQSRPYITPPGSEDQRGFRIYEWYQAVAYSVLQKESPVILLQAGLPGDPAQLDPQLLQGREYMENGLNINRLLAGESANSSVTGGGALEEIPAQVIACNYWLLGADAASPYANQAWFPAGGEKHALAAALRSWRASWLTQAASDQAQKTVQNANHSIRHYLLLPSQEWGVSDWYLEVIRPFVKKYRPTVGFSPDEAERAARVTVIGNDQNFPDNMLHRLRKAGCWVEHISGDGMKIATELAER